MHNSVKFMSFLDFEKIETLISKCLSNNVVPNEHTISDVRSWIRSNNIVHGTHRCTIGTFDSNGNLVSAIAGRNLGMIPAWTPAWCLSNDMSLLRGKIQILQMKYMVNHFESIGLKEIYAGLPGNRGFLLDLMINKILEDRYLCVTETEIPPTTKP